MVKEASKPTADWTHQHPSARDELPFPTASEAYGPWGGSSNLFASCTPYLTYGRACGSPTGFQNQTRQRWGWETFSRGDWFRHYGRVQGSHPWGQQIIDITSELNQAVQMSISCGEKNHPFSADILRRIRQCLGGHTRRWSCRGATLFPHFDFKAGGRPLEIQIWRYPLTLQEGWCQLVWMNLL